MGSHTWPTSKPYEGKESDGEMRCEARGLLRDAPPKCGSISAGSGRSSLRGQTGRPRRSSRQRMESPLENLKPSFELQAIHPGSPRPCFLIGLLETAC